MNWTSELENQVLELRNNGLTIEQIANKMNSTSSAIKHKLRRIGQKSNDERYTHPVEKIEQINRLLPKKDLTILETHAGYGNLTRHYQSLGHEILCIEIERDRANFINQLQLADIDVIHGDSLREMLLLEYNRLYFDVVDLDAYGFPSRFIPSALRLIKDGYLFLTMPKIGVSQMNKITIRHLQSFWQIEPGSKPDLIAVVKNQLDDYAFQNSRSAKLLDVIDLGRMFRFAFRVKREPMTDLVGLKINRKGTQHG